MVTTNELTISKSGVNDVKVLLIKVSHSVVNGVSHLDLPQKDSSDSKAIIVDIGRVKEEVTFDGWLLDETADSSLQKKQRLLTMARDGSSGRGRITFAWGDTPSDVNGNQITGNINKFSVDEFPSTRIGNEGGSDTKGFSIKLSAFRGTHKG